MGLVTLATILIPTTRMATRRIIPARDGSSTGIRTIMTPLWTKAHRGATFCVC